jgi:hypothetical protein
MDIREGKVGGAGIRQGRKRKGRDKGMEKKEREGKWEDLRGKGK